MTEIVSGPRGVEAAEPFLDYALAEFGPDRCLFGSDWPVMTTAGTYSEWLDLVIRLVPGRERASSGDGGDGRAGVRTHGFRHRRFMIMIKNRSHQSPFGK